MKEQERKQVLLRLKGELLKELARWSEDEFRSINGQIEYLLTDAVRTKRKKNLISEEEVENR